MLAMINDINGTICEVAVQKKNNICLSTLLTDINIVSKTLI